MPEIIIDNKRYEFDGEHKLLQFIMDLGKEVPFFCYHPEMSIPANCRQCLVKVGQYMKDRETGEYELDENGEKKIRWFPKLQTSCSVDVQDDMVVHTQETDDEVVRAQKDNLEFLLINHPLDCPICDQAGECPLQIQTYKYGPEGSRFEVKKVHKPKHVDLGPNVTLDAERCINCTRCVRFTQEISETHQLTIVSRGDKNYPITAPGNTFDDPYSLNTVDICPVGALTSSDFRFKARVWEMNQTPSIDVTNAKGCSIDLWTRDNLVLRITPRHNPKINDYWIPDAGRMHYERINYNRISRPEIKLDGDNNAKTSWNNAIVTFAETLEKYSPEKILFIGSPHASNEENYLFSKLAQHQGASAPLFVPHEIPGAGDGFLITDDQAPNANGCRLLGLQEVQSADLKAKLDSGQFNTAIILNDELIDREVLDETHLEGIYTIFFGTNDSKTSKISDLVIPITSIAEHAASYVNIDGIIQRSFPAKETKYTNRRLNLEMSEGRLDRYRTDFDNWHTEENKIDCMPLWQFFDEINEQGIFDLSYPNSREIMAELAIEHEAFTDITYDRIDEENGIQLSIEYLSNRTKV